MASIADELKKLQENPDDLTQLPNLISKVEQIENNEQDYQQRIDTLQQINRSYLAQIPIPGNEPEEKEEPQAGEVSDDDIKNIIMSNVEGE